MIHKIEGCNQMYCVKCGTAFDWKTLKIVTGVVHNPHYFEYQARNGGIPRAIGDIPCGGLPDMGLVWNKISEIYSVDYQLISNILTDYRYLRNRGDELIKKNPQVADPILMIKKLQKWAQAAAHIRGDEIPHFQVGTRFSRNLKKRISFMMNETDEKNLKASIIKKDGDCMKKEEVSQIFVTCATLFEEQLRKSIDKNTKTVDDLNNILDELVKITDYINKCLQNLSNKFKRKMPIIKLPLPELWSTSSSRIHIVRLGATPN